MLNNTSSDFDLIIRQQPNRARVAGGKEKGMWKLTHTHSLLFLASPREPGKRGTDSKGTGSNGACRAQTYRSTPDRPAPGARGGHLPRTVSVPFTVALCTWLTMAQALPAKSLLFHVLQSV